MSSHILVGNRIVQGAIAVVSSLLYLAGLTLFVGSVGQRLIGSSGSGADILFPLAFSAAGCFVLAWFNSRSLISAVLATTVALIAGIALSYLLLAPITEAVVTTVVADTSVTHSGSFSAIWFLLTPVIIIEILTENVIQLRRWGRLLIGIIVSLVFMVGAEFLTEDLGQNSRLDLSRLVIYAPVTWWLVSFSASLNHEEN